MHNNEYFDSRIDGINEEQCGTLCTKTLGCAGFSYDKNKYCYLSKDPLKYNTQSHIYSQFYNKYEPRCDKLYVISDPLYNSRNNLLRNSTYQCYSYPYKKEYIMYNNKKTKIDDITKLNQYDSNIYNFIDFDWNMNPIKSNQ
jgi:hypothetical protein